ncbi:MAG: hypothetical protein ABIS28_05995 [Caldimonas sp.]
MADDATPLALTVHTMPSPVPDDVARRTTRGRLKMLLLLAVCAAPVIASYLAYFVIRPNGRTNYSELILPARPMPAALPLIDLEGRAIRPEALKGQWLLVVVSGGACDAVCERHLWIQRQLREALGRDSDRVDKVWLIDDAVAPRPETLNAVRSGGVPTLVLRVSREALATWLAVPAGGRLESHMAIVDPMGDWMMRVPADPDPARLKRDVERLLRASSGWDRPGR